ncbi:hypothetical protein [Sulfuriferula nivalis]|uniref:Uncharacterized protein n=1 Tax=Sulfuriferula nivalis TaxID=2675298 RepID=A0A809RGT4_9PROT|nr:hypothetical protein [Sulfuriferula nivalis]BBP01089.1 hypothetical protein SFSGTM_17970 [Sulfuriferula nivalis]
MVGERIVDLKNVGRNRFLRISNLLPTLSFIYVALGLVIIYFDLGKHHFAKAFVDIFASIIPSIITTSTLTRIPDSAAVILSIAWVLVVVATMLMIIFVRWKNINYESFYKNTSSWLVLLIFVCIPTLLIFMMYYTPHDIGRLGKFIYMNLKNSSYFVILYGAGIWIGFSAGLFSIAFNLYYLLFRKGINHG